MGFFSTPDGRWLARRFGPKIFVTITDSVIDFRGASRTLSLETAFFVRDDLIVAVGAAPGESCERLAVFVADPEDRAQRFSKLVVYGLWKTIGRSIFIRPVVTVSLRTTLIGPDEVRAAFLRAGACEVLVV